MFSKLFSLVGRTQSSNPVRATRLQLESLDGRDLPSTYYVTSGDDSGSGTLRQAIEDAQDVLDGLDTIVITDDIMFAVVLADPLPTIYENMTIVAEPTGFGDGRRLIRPDDYSVYDFRFIETGTNGVTLTLDNLWLTYFGTTGDGGAILHNGELILTNCRISECAADGNGGAIATGSAAPTGMLSISDCLIEQNDAGGDGGAIFSQADLTTPTIEITHTQIQNNYAGGDGGAIWFTSAAGLLDLDESNLYANEAAGFAGAICQYGGALEYTTSDTDGWYGAIYNVASYINGIFISEPSYIYIDAQVYNPDPFEPDIDIYIIDELPECFIYINEFRVFGDIIRV